VRIGTDSAGLEAPIVALELAQKAAWRLGIELRVRHRFSCELNQECQNYIRLHVQPEHLFADMLARDWQKGSCFCPDVLRKGSLVELPLDLDIYVSGFSCKPFSRRHAGSACFRDPEAMLFWASKEYIERGRPKVALLENVDGRSRKDPEDPDGRSCLDRILAELRSIPGYSVLHLRADPSDYNFPQRRPRFWFWLHRLDATVEDADRLVAQRLDAVKTLLTATFLDYI